MKHEFFSGIAEILSRSVALVLVVLFYTIFFFGRGSIRLDSLLTQGTLILGSVILYELMSFVFYELFSIVESKAWSYFQKNTVSSIDTSDAILPVIESKNSSDIL